MNHPEVIILPALFLTVAYVCSLAMSAWQRRQRLRLVTEFNTRLLERLGSVKDFGEFLATDAGARLMHDLGSEPLAGGPPDRIMRAAQLSAVLICLGLGLLLRSFFATGTAAAIAGHANAGRLPELMAVRFEIMRPLVRDAADTPAAPTDLLNEQTILALYARTAGPLRAYVSRTSGNASLAVDIVQEAFLRLLRRPVPTTDLDELRKYLFRIAGQHDEPLIDAAMHALASVDMEGHGRPLARPASLLPLPR